jgi:predicted dithiol-disulfide oxidoreductase (DUF899 family)
MTNAPIIASRDEWLRARLELLAAEKDLTRRRDELAVQRRALPWVHIDADYQFDTVAGRRSLADLFDGRSRLLMYHFMYGPDWTEGCPSCSFWADNFDGIDVHLAHRDAAFTAISRAPLAKIEKFKKRMGWRFAWLSSAGTDFNFDHGVSFTDDEIERGQAFYNYKRQDAGIHDREGISTFIKDKRGIFHTYSAYARGIEPVNGAYHFIDMLPKGRDEGGDSQAWVRHHDRYED